MTSAKGEGAHRRGAARPKGKPVLSGRGRKKTEAGLAVELETKTSPSQERARATFERILDVTGDLLGEVGFERLSTNMIAQRAGLTPPALYRYFPNKYAILKEMGQRLLDAEDQIVFDWLHRGAIEAPVTLEDDVARNTELLRQVRKAALEQPGGAWILRVMRAVPVLREVRARSIQSVADALFERLYAAHPQADAARLRSATLLSTNMTVAANELMIDNPELEGDLAQEVSRMISLYFRDLLSVP